VGKPYTAQLQDAGVESALACEVTTGGLCSLGLAHEPLVPLLNLFVGDDRLGRALVLGVGSGRHGSGRLGGAPIRRLSFQCGNVEIQLVHDPFEGLGEVQAVYVLNDVEHVASVATGAPVLHEALLQIDGEVARRALAQLLRPENAGPLVASVSVEVKATGPEDALVVVGVEARPECIGVDHGATSPQRRVSPTK